MSRRTVLAGLATMAVAGCAATEEPTSLETLNSLEDSPMATTEVVESTPSETPTPTPTALGARAHLLADFQAVSWVVGPRVIGVEHPKYAYSVLSGGLLDPWTPLLGLTADQTATAQLIAVEQDPEAEDASAQVVLTERAGSGLAGSQVVLTVAIARHATQTVEKADYVVPFPDGETPRLQAATMSGGHTVVALAWDTGPREERTGVVHRVAFTPAGEVAWKRNDTNNTNTDIGYVEKVLPCLNADDLSATTGLVIFGVDDTYVAVDPVSGREKYRAKGPYSSGVVAESPQLFVVVNFENNGVSVIRKSDGQPVGPPGHTAAVDPVTGWAAVAYSTDPDWADASTPAVAMYDASGAPAFTLSRSQASGLGQPEIRSFFDGRVVLTVKDGIRIVKAADGTAEPGFEAIPPGTFRMNNVPVAAGTHAVVLGPTDGLGNLGESDYGLVAVISDEPLAWDLLSVALPGSE